MYIIIISSYLNNFLDNFKILDYDQFRFEFLDRNAKVYQTFLDLLSYRLTIFEKKILFENNLSQIEEIWHGNINVKVCSYWLLLINGIDISNEYKIANEILIWERFQAGGESRSVILQPTDKYFYEVSKKFDLMEFPAIVLSNSTNMRENIVIKASPLLNLISDKNALRRFIVKTHIQLKNGLSIDSIRKRLKTKEYWEKLIKNIHEFKDLIPLIG